MLWQRRKYFLKVYGMFRKLIDVAAKREEADLILKNLQIVNVFSGDIQKGDIAVSCGRIAAIGDYDNSRNIIDCNGAYAMPGFIDSHVHIESSHLTPGGICQSGGGAGHHHGNSRPARDCQRMRHQRNKIYL